MSWLAAACVVAYLEIPVVVPCPLLAVADAVGVLDSVLPAWRAATLDPTDAPRR